MNKNNITLKYNCLDKLNDILSRSIDTDIKTFIQEMYELILYQIEEINNQRRQIIAQVHKESWKQYDQKDLEENTQPIQLTIDKPETSGRMGC